MQCPACRAAALVEDRTPAGLAISHCPACDGRWLPFDEHLRWVESGEAARTAAAPPATPPASAPEASRKARLCPRCGRLMTRHRVALDLPFQLDRCGLCAGVWFDPGEWTAVEARGLLPRLNHLFNDAHQRQLELEERRRTHEARCRAIVGDESFARLAEVKRWLDAHPHRAALMAYLEDREV